MDLSTALSLPELSGILAFVALFTVWAINRLRSTLYEHTKWAARIPGWCWWMLSVAIPVCFCVVLNLNVVRAMVAGQTGGLLDMAMPYGSVGSGVAVAMASNGSYALLKKAGLTAEAPKPVCESTAQVGSEQTNAVASQAEPIITEPVILTNEVCLETNDVESALVGHAMLLQRIYYPADGPERYVSIGGQLHPVDNG